MIISFLKLSEAWYQLESNGFVIVCTRGLREAKLLERDASPPVLCLDIRLRDPRKVGFKKFLLVKEYERYVFLYQNKKVSSLLYWATDWVDRHLAPKTNSQNFPVWIRRKPTCLFGQS